MALYLQSNEVLELPDNNYQILEKDNGKVFCIMDLTGAVEYTLPAIQPGLHYVFINRALAANNAIIEGGAGNVKGVLIRAGVATATAAGANGRINFIGGTSVVGDRAEFYCDGVQWSVTAFSAAGAGITAT